MSSFRLVMMAEGSIQSGFLKKAVERGIVANGAALSQQELHQLIFAPGFSTAEVVSSVSGRGVGMDVVHREIEALGGTVLVESEKGRGTRVTLKIPLTLAIIEGLLVRVGNEYFVIPLSFVDGCIEHSHEMSQENNRQSRLLHYRNEMLPCTSLRQLFDIDGEIPKIEQIVVVNSNEARIGFVVDQVVGDYQTVIKPLGRMFKNSEGLSGATILGDGRVGLILDVHRLAQLAQREEERSIKNEREILAVGV
ncbi:hypothetical protein MASR2M78_28980 [Treponema sp.]